MDTTDIRAQTAEIQKIGVNVNQIAKRLNKHGAGVRAGHRGYKGGADADMAVTKIHPIKSTLKKALDYIENPDKTYDKMLVSSFACSYETADIEFEMLLAQAYQKGNNLAHHLIQSFAPGEATPEQAHEIGRQLADEVLQGKYPYVLTTHIDKGHVHNHIIFCAVDMVNQRKYISNKQSYVYIRRTSDRLCKENGLSVVKPGQSNNSVQMVLTLRFMQKPRFEKSRCSCIAILVPLPMKSKRNVHFSRVAITHTTVYEMPCAGIFSLRPTLNTWKFSRFLLIYH